MQVEQTGIVGLSEKENFARKSQSAPLRKSQGRRRSSINPDKIHQKTAKNSRRASTITEKAIGHTELTHTVMTTVRFSTVVDSFSKI